MKLGRRRTPGGQRKLVQRRGFSVAEVAQMFGACEMTVRRAIKAGELRAIRLRGRIVVPAEAVDAMTAASADLKRAAVEQRSSRWGGLMQRFEECRLREAAELSSPELQDRTRAPGPVRRRSRARRRLVPARAATTSTRARTRVRTGGRAPLLAVPVRAECLELALRTEVGRPAGGSGAGSRRGSARPLMRARQQCRRRRRLRTRRSEH